eukprot:TCALIF_10837-PA protein Name:"Similar to rnf146 E3 ubiquitin-protein ligase rnf146 (Salmo salar)" AED:0.12 eAED:0.27 QI:0/0/0/1/1/1/2/0/358
MASVGGGNNDSSSNSRVHGSEASGGSSCCPPSSPPSPSSPLKSKKALECAVCLQTCVHPVQLDCSHIFCFLCVKGVALQSRRCPMCRGDIPPTFLDNPKLLEPLNKTDVGHDSPEIEQEHNSANEDATTENLSDSEDDNGHVDHPLHSDDQEQEQSAEEQSDEDKFCWFYEGRNGWWQYDVRTSQELESFHQNGAVTCELLIAGFLYTIDFRSMVQFRRNEPNRRRQIKRDLATISKKGIAGLRLHNNGQHSTLSTKPNWALNPSLRGPLGSVPDPPGHPQAKIITPLFRETLRPEPWASCHPRTRAIAMMTFDKVLDDSVISLLTQEIPTIKTVIIEFPPKLRPVVLRIVKSEMLSI